VNDFAELIEALDGLPAAGFEHAAAALLVEPHDWTAIARAGVEQLGETEFCEQARRSHVALVEPTPFLLHAGRQGQYQIVLNHFERPRFDALLDAGRINPHVHHFAFAARLLSGGYHHWLYRKRGADGELELVSHTAIGPGDVYALTHEVYHLELSPEHDSLSLMVRGRALYDPGHVADPGYDRKTILQRRARLLQLLVRPSSAAPGRRFEWAMP
jgi:hypothetical protein